MRMGAVQAMFGFLHGLAGRRPFSLPDAGFVEHVPPMSETFVDFSAGGQVQAAEVVENVGLGGHGCDTRDALGVAE